MPDRKTVMISSTAHDLPEHRKEALDACLRQGMFPVMMEHLPASNNEAISASLAMVDAAGVYVGIFTHRYGYVPAGHTISVTEMEHNRAVERRSRGYSLIIMAETLNEADWAKARPSSKRSERLLADNIVNFFKSPADLRVLVINSLSQQREPDLATFPLRQRHPCAARGVPCAPVHPPADAPTGWPPGGAQSCSLIGWWVSSCHCPCATRSR